MDVDDRCQDFFPDGYHDAFGLQVVPALTRE